MIGGDRFDLTLKPGRDLPKVHACRAGALLGMLKTLGMLDYLTISGPTIWFGAPSGLCQCNLPRIYNIFYIWYAHPIICYMLHHYSMLHAPPSRREHSHAGQRLSFPLA